ncbi:MAG: hypothetical protein Q8Q31_02180 [Nanoarchaeota archaeon]|nr:hypothetical protein [Nanoarchaeota archaeon]
MRSVFGYILAGIGIVGTALASIKELRGIVSFLPQPVISSGSFLIVSLALVGIGIIVAVSDGSGKNKKGEEVPIYDQKGKKVVGYRRLK